MSAHGLTWQGKFFIGRMVWHTSHTQILTRAPCCIVVLKCFDLSRLVFYDTVGDAHLVSVALSCLSGMGSTGGKGLAATARLPSAFEEPWATLTAAAALPFLAGLT